MTKKISIVTPCYNEEFNVEPLYEKVKIEMAKLSNYTYEHIFIDNYSTDNTLVKLKSIASVDKNVKIIVNARNFGHIKSPYYGMLQADGDVVISLVSDLQDPPELIPDFIKKWEEGYKIVKKTSSCFQFVNCFIKPSIGFLIRAKFKISLDLDCMTGNLWMY